MIASVAVPKFSALFPHYVQSTQFFNRNRSFTVKDAIIKLFSHTARSEIFYPSDLILKFGYISIEEAKLVANLQSIVFTVEVFRGSSFLVIFQNTFKLLTGIFGIAWATETISI